MNKSIEPLNNKHQRHGLWKKYIHNGDLWYKCFYHNDKLVGYEELYSYDVNIAKKRYYL